MAVGRNFAIFFGNGAFRADSGASGGGSRLKAEHFPCILISHAFERKGRNVYQDDRKRRWAVFATGLAVAGIGVALTTQAGLGTSPISSVPYVLTFIVPLSFGLLTLLVNVFLVLGQVALLRREFRNFQYLQIAATGVFGLFIDLGMWMTAPLRTGIYPLQVAELVAGCLLLAAGISFQIIADVMYIPGEGMVKAIAGRLKCQFGSVKVCFDISLVALAVVLSAGFLAEIRGLREGTLFAAFLVGTFTRLLLRRVRPLKLWFYVRRARA